METSVNFSRCDFLHHHGEISFAISAVTQSFDLCLLSLLYLSCSEQSKKTFQQLPSVMSQTRTWHHLTKHQTGMHICIPVCNMAILYQEK